VKTRLAILLWSATEDRPELCAAPFIYAMAATALDCRVEIHFTGRATRLLLAGVAEQLYPTADGTKSIYVFMKEASYMGADFIACGMALGSHTRPGDVFIPEYSGNASATEFVLRTLDPEWATLVF
jgi:predicted peroxiredoxin